MGVPVGRWGVGRAFRSATTSCASCTTFFHIEIIGSCCCCLLLLLLQPILSNSLSTCKYKQFARRGSATGAQSSVANRRRGACIASSDADQRRPQTLHLAFFPLANFSAKTRAKTHFSAPSKINRYGHPTPRPPAPTPLPPRPSGWGRRRPSRITRTAASGDQRSGHSLPTGSHPLPTPTVRITIGTRFS